MGFRNTGQRYGSVAQLLHWLMAVAIFGLFALGLWMTSLDYYDAWYTRGPYWHEGIGLIVFAAFVFRLYWRATNVRPDDGYLRPMERIGAAVAHWGMDGLLAMVVISGYLISTGDGRPVSFFGVVSVPSVVDGEQLTDQAGKAHFYAAFALIAVAALHTVAALKHHFVDQHPTLRRMLPGDDPLETPRSE